MASDLMASLLGAPSWERGSQPLTEPGLGWGGLLQWGLLWGELSRVHSPQVVKMSGGDPERPQFLFVKVLASWGRLEAVTQQMGYHPQYLDSFLKTQHYLMHMDGPLPFDCRHYIAIMVSPAGSWQRGRGALLSPVRLPALHPADSLCHRLLCSGQNHDVLEFGREVGAGSQDTCPAGAVQGC